MRQKNFTAGFHIFIFLIITALIVACNKAKNPFSQESPCDQYTKHYSIKDPSHPLALEGKTTFLESTKISENYFNEHFIFQCASIETIKNESYPSKVVLYKYNIGDYSVLVSLYNTIGSKEKLAPNYDRLHEIKSVISKEEAMEKLTTCLSSKPLRPELQLSSDGLYLIGSSEEEMLGIVNVETGECKKHPLYKK